MNLKNNIYINCFDFKYLEEKDSNEKDINDIIIELIKKSKKDEYFGNEYCYYLTKDNLQSRIDIKKIKTIMESIEEFNSKVQRRRGNRRNVRKVRLIQI